MKWFSWGVMGMLLIAVSAQAGLINGVANITVSSGNNNAGTGGTNLQNTGTILDGLYGTENLGYLVDDFPGTLGYDGLVIKATAVVNNKGTVSGADNSAILGYSNPVTGHRSETNFGISLLGPNDGRIFLFIGGGIKGPLGNWASTFGRNNPFDINLSASLVGNQLTVSGTITDSDMPANQILVNNVSTVGPTTQSTAFGTSSGFEQPGTLRNFGVEFSNVMYGNAVPEPSCGLLVLAGLACLGGARRERRDD